MSAVTNDPSVSPVAGRRRGWRPPRAVTGTWTGRIALTIAILVILVALFGSLVTPHSPASVVGPGFSTPSGQFPLGLDYAGEDVFSRLLAGGRTVILVGVTSTLIGYLVGGIAGLLAGYQRRWVDAVLMRIMDVLLAFPPVIFLLLLATGFGNSLVALILGIAVVHVPGVARIVRTATLEVSVRGYVEAAAARGDRVRVILRREILPNIWGPIIADGGPRFTTSILLIAAVNFLGLGIAPPQADWALMISENRPGLTINPISVVAPALMIGILTVSLNVVADQIARSIGTSLDIEAMRR